MLWDCAFCGFRCLSDQGPRPPGRVFLIFLISFRCLSDQGPRPQQGGRGHLPARFRCLSDQGLTTWGCVGAVGDVGFRGDKEESFFEPIVARSRSSRLGGLLQCLRPVVESFLLYHIVYLYRAGHGSGDRRNFGAYFPSCSSCGSGAHGWNRVLSWTDCSDIALVSVFRWRSRSANCIAANEDWFSASFDFALLHYCRHVSQVLWICFWRNNN
ncbi:hypothetical protein BMERY_0984 [Bifidobacterium merycicum]|uniref:Uncharacterized protein n=1 Tax=Bifidobacterium merycicum TaxID=78345 RepID=A0A087BKD0_9BIFI|nr:hypothetical protein BMERY_0984 [Bifidobacterium merycicum]